jgi:hypothetical protein
MNKEIKNITDVFPKKIDKQNLKEDEVEKNHDK